MGFKKVSHVLFDLDGLLIDSETCYTKAFEIVCARYGKEFTWELNASLLGFQGHECAEKIVKTLNLPVTKEDFQKQYYKEAEVLFSEVQLMPGVRKLVEHLYSNRVPMALATSSKQGSVDLKMRNYKDILDKFHHLTMGSSDPEVEKGKPDPAIFLVCASRFPNKPKPEECLVFEDAVNGVKAANAANMQVVAVPDSRIQRGELQIATMVLNSLEEFRPDAFGLPSF